VNERVRLLLRAARKPDVGFLLALFLLALALRCLRTGLMEFKHDEAAGWLMAHGLRAGIHFPSTGLFSSKGVENFPLFIYILTAFQTVFRRPDMVVWPIAFLNSLAILPIFSATRKLFDRRTAWLTCIMYSFAPASVFFSRKIWAQDMLPFWASVMFWLTVGLMEGDREKRSGPRRFLLGFMAVTAFQIHLSSLFLLPAFLVIVCLYRERFRPFLPLCLGILGGLIPAIPYFVHVIPKLDEVAGILHEEVGGGLRFRLKELVLFFVRQTSDEGLPALLGPDYHRFLSSVPMYNLLRHVLSALVVAGAGICAARIVRGGERERRAGVLLLLLMGVPLVLLALSRIALFPSYFLIFCPLPFLLAALAVVTGAEILARPIHPAAMRLVLIGCAAFLLIGHLAYHVQFLRLIKEHGGTRGDYGICFAETLRAARWLKERRVSPGSLRPEDLPLSVALLTLDENQERGKGEQERGKDEPGHSSERPASQHQDSQSSGFLLVNRLVYPVLDAESAQWLLEESKAYYLLEPPLGRLGELQVRYPAQVLTSRQAAEARDLLKVAVRLSSRER